MHAAFLLTNLMERDHLQDLGINNCMLLELAYGPGSSVGTATELWAGRSGVESRWGRDFPTVQTGPEAHPVSCKMGTGSFPGGKVRPGRAADHSPPSSAAVMEE